MLKRSTNERQFFRGEIHFFFPDGLTGHDCRAGPVFFCAIVFRWAADSLLAALAGRHAG